MNPKILISIFALMLIVGTLEMRARQQSTTGTASFYSDRYEGRKMANGEKFSQGRLTCASNRWPLGTKLRVSNGPREVTAIVTDRGPDKSLNRMLDLSKSAFRRLGPIKAGLITVEARISEK